MRILCIKHGDFETCGIVPKWAQDNDHEIEYCTPAKGEDIPPPEDYDMLLVFGGPQSPLEIKKDTTPDVQAYPSDGAEQYRYLNDGSDTIKNTGKYLYLLDEINAIRNAIDAEKMVFGFCLGGQLVGEAVGAKTERCEDEERGFFREYGVFKMELTDAAQSDPITKDLPQSFDAPEFHNDMAGKTSDNTSVILAKSEACPRQIMRFADNAYAFQFHAELTKSDLEMM